MTTVSPMAPTRPSAAAPVTPLRRHVRSTVDVVRLGLGCLTIAVGLLVANTFDSTLLGLADDANATIDRFPQWLRDVAAASLASIVIAGATAAAIFSLATTRYRRFALFAAGFALAAAVSIVVGSMIYAIVDEEVRMAFDVDVPIFRWTGADDRLSPSDPLLAGAVAGVTIGSSFLSQQLTKRAWLLLGAYLVGSALTIGVPSLALLTDLGAGLAVGSLLLLTFGRHDLALRADDVITALRSSGIEVADLSPVDAPERGGWAASLPSDAKLFVSGFDRDDRSADLLVRLARWLRLRKTGDHRPFVSLRRSVEHEALVTQQAANFGVRAPTIRAVAGAGVDGMVLARDWIDGSSAATHQLSDAMVRDIWREVQRLHAARIAHGTLHLASVTIDREGQPWLTNFERGELAAPPQRIGTDIAELLAATAAVVGTARAARLAHDVLGSQALQSAVPWLQPLALTRETRNAIKAASGIEALRNQVVEDCGADAEELVRLERIEAKTLFILATIVLSAWFLVPQLADLDSIWSQVRSGSWGWAILAGLFSTLTYVAATSALLGAIPTRLSFGPALLAQIASSFANRVTPAKVGGVATNIRYFQRQGVPTAVGVTAVGLNAVAGIIMHITLTLCFLLLASGADTANGIELPSTVTLVVALGAAVATIGAAFAVPPMRRLLDTHVVPQIKSGWQSMRTIAHDPARLVALLGGSAAITLFYLAAMAASLEAFGSTASLPATGLLFLTGSAVANAAPTPGGLGAAEAALIAAFSTVEDSQVVIPAVFLYRLVTFWLPILPGWLALTYLRRTDRI